MKTFLRFKFALALLLLCALAGCRPNQPTKPVATSEEASASPDMDLGSEADLSSLIPKSPIDLEWEKVLTTLQPPPYPEEWNTREPSKEDIAQWEYTNGQLAAQAATNAARFYAQYPDHPKAAEAREREYSLLNIAAQLGHSNILAQLLALEEKQLQDPSLTEEKRFEVRLQQLQREVMTKKKDSLTAALSAMENGFRVLEKEFPKQSQIHALLLTLARGWAENGDAEKALGLAREATQSTDEEVKSSAQGLVTKLERIGKPLALKFKAIDGRDIDLAQFKGKVVLVDFWATWCKPCMNELPTLKATYEQLHEKGFEIVGISLDQEKPALERVVAAEKLPWPQYFDGGKDEETFAEKFQVESIPTMWLVDKTGVLRDLNAREDLAGKVEKLLAQ